LKPIYKPIKPTLKPIYKPPITKPGSITNIIKVPECDKYITKYIVTSSGVKIIHICDYPDNFINNGDDGSESAFQSHSSSSSSNDTKV